MRQAMQRRSRFRLRWLPVLGGLGVAVGLAFATTGSAADAQARLLVKFAPGTSGKAQASAVATVSGRELRQISDLGVHVVSVSAGNASSALAHLERSAGVEFAEPDVVLQPQDNLPSDPSFPKSFSVGGG